MKTNTDVLVCIECAQVATYGPAEATNSMEVTNAIDRQNALDRLLKFHKANHLALSHSVVYSSKPCDVCCFQTAGDRITGELVQIGNNHA